MSEYLASSPNKLNPLMRETIPSVSRRARDCVTTAAFLCLHFNRPCNQPPKGDELAASFELIHHETEEIRLTREAPQVTRPVSRRQA